MSWPEAMVRTAAALAFMSLIWAMIIVTRRPYP